MLLETTLVIGQEYTISKCGSYRTFKGRFIGNFSSSPLAEPQPIFAIEETDHTNKLFIEPYKVCTARVKTHTIAIDSTMFIKIRLESDKVAHTVEDLYKQD